MFSLFAAWGFLLLMVQAAPLWASVQPQCAPAFPREQGKPLGWQGADDAYSVPIGPGHDLWTFGDTLYGPQRAWVDSKLRMVHNSLGLSSCGADGRWSIRYLLRSGQDGQAKSFFTPRDPAHWYWPMDGVRIGSRVFISLLCLRRAGTTPETPFDFKVCGVDLASLPVQISASSQPTIQPIVPDGAAAWPASTLVLDHGDYLYFVGTRSGKTQPLVAFRIAVAHLSSVSGKWETLARDGRWHRGFLPEKAQTLFEPGATEMTIRFHPRWHRWLAVYKDPDLLSDAMLMRSAAALSGPWSVPELLFHIQALDPRAAAPGVFCYAGKEHPELGSADTLLVTFVCNASDPHILVERPNIYIPRAVSVSLDRELRVRGVRVLRDLPR